MRSLRTALTVLLAISALACAASRSWKQALADDTAAGYHRFLREHPRSSLAGEARERLDFVRARKKPTQEAYQAFAMQYPDSRFLAELRPAVESAAFDRARASGSVDAYRKFLGAFPDGRNAARARGNAAFLERYSRSGQTDALVEFATRHPESDFAVEARRSAAGVTRRGQTAFRRVALLVDVAASTPNPDRLTRVFTEHALRQYQATGLELVPLQGRDDPRAASFPALITVHHSEGEVSTELKGDRMTAPGILATTRVTLARSGESAPIWSDEFTFRASAAERPDGNSILFGPTSQRYWSSFFVPVASWDTQVAIRRQRAFDRPPVAVAALGSRASVLFDNGDFQVFDLGDPANPLLLGEYKRPRDLARWSGLRMAGERVALFGEDGIEIVQIADAQPRRELALGREVVGSVVAMESVGNDWLAAGKRGLLYIDGRTGRPSVLVQGEVRGLAMRGDRLLFTDGTSLYVSTLPMLRTHRTLAELRLGKGFGPGRVRVRGSSAIVLGARGVVRLDLSNPSSPRLLSRIDMLEVGEVEDAVLAGGRLFLLGARGLQVTDPSGEHVVDSADVSARRRIGATGRHLVLIGEKGLQVVDTTPFVVPRAAASRRP
ncbi:MAG: hypothetical protein V3U03_16690 [Myxococcota bacterium]